MARLLLDSHTLLWLMQKVPLREQARAGIAIAIQEHSLFVSTMLPWEIGTSALKKNESRRPDLQGLTVRQWTTRATRHYGLNWLSITHDIALEAAEVPAVYGSGDPGDCFLIATARVHSLALVTRDERILALAAEQPEYLRVLGC